MSTPDEMEQQIDRMAAQVQSTVERYRLLEPELARISVTVSSSDGAVAVTVGQSGLLLELKFAQHAASIPVDQLAVCILDTMKRAQAQLGPRIIAIMERVVPEDTASIQTIRESYERQFAYDEGNQLFSSGPIEQSSQDLLDRLASDRDDGNR